MIEALYLFVCALALWTFLPVVVVGLLISRWAL